MEHRQHIARHLDAGDDEPPREQTVTIGQPFLTSKTGTCVLGDQTCLPRDVDYGEDRIGIILEEYNVGPEAVAAIEQLLCPRRLQVSSRRFAKTIVCAVRCSNRVGSSHAIRC